MNTRLSSSEEPLRLIAFALGGEDYCMNMSSVAAIHQLEHFQPSSADGEPLGWLVINREKTAVYSMARLLGKESNELSAEKKIIVSDAETDPRAFMVDKVLGVIEADSDDLFPLPSLMKKDCSGFIKGVLKVEKRFIPYLSPEGVLNEVSKDLKTLERHDAELQPKRTLPALPPGIRSVGKVILFSTSSEAGGKRVVFALSLQQVIQVIEPLPIMPLPSLPPYVLGIVSFRSRPVPILDLNARFGLEETSFHSNSRLLIARAAAGELVGLLVQPNLDVRNLPIKSKTLNLDFPSQDSGISGIFELEDAILVVPDIDGITGCRVN